MLQLKEQGGGVFGYDNGLKKLEKVNNKYFVVKNIKRKKGKRKNKMSFFVKGSCRDYMLKVIETFKYYYLKTFRLTYAQYYAKFM